MNLNPVILSIPLYFVLIGIELLVNRFQKKNLYRLNDAVTNISCGITQQLTGIFLKVFEVGIYMLVYENFAFHAITSNWITISILFVAADFCYYWAHRMSHEVNLFWGGHVVHHQSEDYNLSVALRQSTFQVLWTFAFHLPLALIGFRTEDFILVMGLNLIYQFWIHTETIGKMGWFEYIFNTPSHHRVHHGRNPKYIDKNHAGVFIIWDKMFGTFQKEEEKPTYGVTHPVKSWNPVWVNMEHYVHMYRMLQKIKGLGNKIKYMLYKPGWFPKEMGGYHPAPEIDTTTYKKFDTQSYVAVNYYVLFQYILALGGTSFFLFNQINYDITEKALISALIISTIALGGVLFEGRSWAIMAESIRILTISAAGIIWSSYIDWNIIVISACSGYFLISIIWLLSLRKAFTPSTASN